MKFKNSQVSQKNKMQKQLSDENEKFCTHSLRISFSKLSLKTEVSKDLH